MPDLFDSIGDWLIKRALGDGPLPEMLTTLGTKLMEGGVPVGRMSLGRTMMHPVIGLMDHTWTAGSDRIETQMIPRTGVTPELFREGPFGELANFALSEEGRSGYRRLSDVPLTSEEFPWIHVDPGDADTIGKYPLYQRLAAQGFRGYAATTCRFGEQEFTFTAGVPFLTRASASFATKRFGGFTDAEKLGFRRILGPLMVATRVATERFLVTELLETYVGRNSGKAVLAGQVERGDVRSIECVLLYSDMRGSTRLAQELPPPAFFAVINTYFDCVAQAVMDHGGEVLKFIGDGVLAIFPIDDAARPRANMCNAALSAARDAFARASQANAAREGDGHPPFAFGIALHVGDVLYGNAGTEKRLDFTATGPAVALVSRCEGQTRPLGRDLLATADFAAEVAEQGEVLPPVELNGFPEPVGMVAFPV